jgi:hypothetical protein
MIYDRRFDSTIRTLKHCIEHPCLSMIRVWQNVGKQCLEIILPMGSGNRPPWLAIL